MWSLNDVSEFELREGFSFFFFCLVNLFTLEQIFAVVKIRHSSLILKEVLHPCSDIQSCTTSPKPHASCQNFPKDSLSQVGTKWCFVLEAQTNMSLHVWSNHQSRWWSHPIPGPFQWLSPDWNCEADFHFHKESMHEYAPKVDMTSSSTVECKQLHDSTFQNSAP